MLAILLAGLLPLLGLLLFSSSTQLAVRTTLLFPSFFAAFPQSPADLLRGTPQRSVIELAPVDGYVRAHLDRLPGGRRPALIISLGINPAPPDDPRVVRLLDGLARSGLVAVLVESEALNGDNLFPNLPQALIETVQYIVSQPYVRADRVGLFGFSVGGSLALDAAADPAIRDRLRLVEAFGSFSDLRDALLSVATHTLDDNGVVKPWEPDPAAQRHLANALINGLSDPGEQQALRSVFVDGTAAASSLDPGTLSREARAVYELLTTSDREQGQALLPALPSRVQADIAALSPLPRVPELRAPVFIMYDREDPLLPFTGSRALCAAVQAQHIPLYCSPFSLFKHVDPTRGGNPLVVAHDLVELFMHAFAVLQRLQ
ncbi:MAG TPA: hypothetical protein VFA70_05290 [Dehalococcoidia bacterium]|nr:hypothetical protein [Dehalococcoidia bacterium]